MLRLVTTGSTQEQAAAGRSDDALVADYRAGDQDGFAALYDRYRGPVYRFLLRQLPEAAAQDLFQETWMKILRALQTPTYQAQGVFEAYLFRTAHNLLMDHFRREARRPVQSSLEVEQLSEDLEDELSQEQLRERLYQEVAKLPVEQRSVWLIKQESALDMQAIADITSTSLEGVKSRLRYANDKLKAGMQRYVRS